jgi:hypothetical protein
MPIRYWLLHPAVRGTIGGLLAIAVVTIAYLFVTTFWPIESPPYKPQSVETEAAYLAKNLDADCLALLAAPPVPDPTPKQTDDCRDKEAVQKYNHASLMQSVRSANAAVYSAYVVYLQTCIGIIGAILVVATLTASVIATWAARNAARGTIDAAKATRDAVELSQRQFVLTHRPKLRVRKVRILRPENGRPASVALEVANVGDTEAIITGVKCQIFAKAELKNFYFPGGSASTRSIGPDGTPRIAVFPGVEAGNHTTIELKTDMTWEESMMGILPEIVVRGEVRYRDTFPGADVEKLLRYMEGRRFESTDRETSFERFYSGRAQQGVLRFVRTKEPDPEYEYED